MKQLFPYRGWIIGTYPLFMRCVLCQKLIFFPLAHFLTGTNMCLGCHVRLCKHIKRWGLEYILGKLLAKYHCFYFFHKYYLEGGSVPNNGELASSLFRCNHCYSSKKIYETKEENKKRLIEQAEIINSLEA